MPHSFQQLWSEASWTLRNDKVWELTPAWLLGASGSHLVSGMGGNQAILKTWFWNVLNSFDNFCHFLTIYGVPCIHWFSKTDLSFTSGSLWFSVKSQLYLVHNTSPGNWRNSHGAWCDFAFLAVLITLSERCSSHLAIPFWPTEKFGGLRITLVSLRAFKACCNRVSSYWLLPPARL